MELAIPLLALGSMYIISNQKNNSNNNSNNSGGSGSGVKREAAHEGYENMGERQGQLPNTNLLPNNYPVQQATSVGKDINGYANPNFAMDRYYNDQLSSKLVAGGNQFGDPYTGGSFESLSGSRVNSSDFNHNNMVPFSAERFADLRRIPTCMKRCLITRRELGRSTSARKSARRCLRRKTACTM